MTYTTEQLREALEDRKRPSYDCYFEEKYGCPSALVVYYAARDQLKNLEAPVEGKKDVAAPREEVVNLPYAPKPDGVWANETKECYKHGAVYYYRPGSKFSWECPKCFQENSNGK